MFLRVDKKVDSEKEFGSKDNQIKRKEGFL